MLFLHYARYVCRSVIIYYLQYKVKINMIVVIIRNHIDDNVEVIRFSQNQVDSKCVIKIHLVG